MTKKADLTVTLAHGALVDGTYKAPGTKITLRNEDEVQSLTAAGYVVTDEPVGETADGAAGT